MPDLNSLFSFTLHYLAPVGAVMLLGLLGGKAAKFVKLPKVSGYFLVGVLIGPSVLGFLRPEIVVKLTIIKEIALGLIMFTLGGLFEIHRIRKIARKVLWLTLGQSVGAFLVTGTALYLAGISANASVLLAAIAIATAPAVALLVVREYNAQGEFTDTLMTVIALSSVISILVFQVSKLIQSVQVVGNWYELMLIPAYEIGGAIVIGSLVGYLIAWCEERVEDAGELFIIVLAGIMLVTGISYSFNLQPLLANIITGVVAINVSMTHRLIQVELRQIEQPLYIALFVLVGASLRLELLPSVGLAGLLFLVCRVCGKMLGVYFCGRAAALTTHEQNFFGLGMLPQATVAIGLLATLPQDEPYVYEVIAPIVLSSVLIFETVGPPLVKWLLFKSGDAKAN